MIKAVLLDLDNTLLQNPDAVFAPQYLQLAEEFFARKWHYAGFARALVQAIQVMSDARDGVTSNTRLVLEVLERATLHETTDILEAFDEFYQHIYPALKSCVQPVDGALDLIAYLKSQNLAVVIATNPVYPSVALQQRLAWAGLPSAAGDYALVTSSDNMHFVKPSPVYYGEILGRLGVEPDEALMVGDNLDNDIRPAALIGIHTCHVAPSFEEEISGRNSLRDFFVNVSRHGLLDSLLPEPLRPEMIEPQLRGNVGALFGMLDNVRPTFWSQHPDPNEWSILQILCHLWDSEASVQRPRLERIMNERNPFLADPQAPPGPEAEVCNEDGYHIAHEFAAEREATVRFLQTLPQEDWQRPARHSIFGPTNLLEMALFTAQHDRLHLKQLCQTIGKCQ